MVVPRKLLDADGDLLEAAASAGELLLPASHCPLSISGKTVIALTSTALALTLDIHAGIVGAARYIPGL